LSAVATRFSFGPFGALIERIVAGRVERFSEIEDEFMAAMSDFDMLQAAGELTSGQYQAKGLFFNEIIARLIERGAGQGVAQRGKRRGILLANVDVDICFPADPKTRPEVIAETKMMGTPKHPRSPKAGPLGRPGSRDLDKRVREIALNVIDLKLADVEGGSTPIGDIATWIQQTTPPFFGFFAIRVVGDTDRRAAESRAQLLANSYANGVGLFLYGPVDPETDVGRVTYRVLKPPGGMAIDDAVTRICRQIRSAAGKAPREAERSPAEELPPLPEEDRDTGEDPADRQLRLE
jgi:hypothetical protein